MDVTSGATVAQLKKELVMTIDNSRYAARGVSSGKEEVHEAIKDLDRGLFPGAFCSIFPDIAGDPAYGSIQHVDGAGTKSSLAYLARTTARASTTVWEGIAQDALVMNVDDIACVGAVGKMHVSQTIGRNKFLVGADDVAALVAGCRSFCKRMSEYGFELVYVGGETADVADLVRTVIVDNAVSARIRLSDVIDASRMVPGDVIIGFSSTGKALWEDYPNSGIGANGLTNARHDVLCRKYVHASSTYAPELEEDLVYQGIYGLEDQLPGNGLSMDVGSALLSPTRTYLPLIGKLLELLPREAIHGLIHCTGGGQTKIRKFGAAGNLYVKDDLFPVPQLFKFLQRASLLPWDEMYKTYNMGHRLEAVVPIEAESVCFAAAEWAGIEARRVGRVKRMPGTQKRRVMIVSPHTTFSC